MLKYLESDVGVLGGESEMLRGDGLQLCRNSGSLTLSDELWMSEFVRIKDEQLWWPIG